MRQTASRETSLAGMVKLTSGRVRSASVTPVALQEAKAWPPYVPAWTVTVSPAR